MSDQPWLDALVLLEEESVIYHEVTNDRHAGQGPDDQAVRFSECFLNGLDACQRVLAIDIHPVRTANPLPARASIGQRRIPLSQVFQGIQNHSITEFLGK